MNSKSVKEGGKHNMYSKSKRFIASFLAVLMAVCMLPVDMFGAVGVVNAAAPATAQELTAAMITLSGSVTKKEDGSYAAEYTGSAIAQPSVAVTVDDAPVGDAQYAVTYTAGTNVVDNAKVTVTPAAATADDGDENTVIYGDAIDVPITITAKALTDEDVTVTDPTEASGEPTVSVTGVNDTVLTENNDYTVSVDTTAKTVTVEGKGNYSGTVTKTYTVPGGGDEEETISETPLDVTIESVPASGAEVQTDSTIDLSLPAGKSGDIYFNAAKTTAADPELTVTDKKVTISGTKFESAKQVSELVSGIAAGDTLAISAIVVSKDGTVYSKSAPQIFTYTVKAAGSTPGDYQTHTLNFADATLDSYFTLGTDSSATVGPQDYKCDVNITPSLSGWTYARNSTKIYYSTGHSYGTNSVKRAISINADKKIKITVGFFSGAAGTKGCVWAGGPNYTDPSTADPAASVTMTNAYELYELKTETLAAGEYGIGGTAKFAICYIIVEEVSGDAVTPLTNAKVTLSMAGEANWTAADSTTWTKDYTGSDIKPEVSVALADNTPVPENGYTVTYARGTGENGTTAPEADAYVTENEFNFKNAGTIFVKVTGKGNYDETTSAVASYKIAKAALSTTSKEHKVDIAQVPDTVTDGKWAQSVNLNTLFEFPANTEVTYKNATLTNPSTDSTPNNVLAEDAVAISTTNPLELTFTSVTTAPDNMVNAVVTVDAEFANYVDTTLTITISLTSKTALTITGAKVTGAGKEYDGKPVAADLSDVTITGGTNLPTDFKDTLEVKFSTQAGDALDTPPTNEGAYVMTVSVPSTNTDYSGTQTVNFTIEKKALTLKAANRSWVKGYYNTPLTTAKNSTLYYNYDELDTKEDGVATNTNIAKLLDAGVKVNMEYKFNGAAVDWTTIAAGSEVDIIPSMTFEAPSDAPANTTNVLNNYNITVVNGKLTVMEEEAALDANVYELNFTKDWDAASPITYKDGTKTDGYFAVDADAKSAGAGNSYPFIVYDKYTSAAKLNNGKSIKFTTTEANSKLEVIAHVQKGKSLTVGSATISVSDAGVASATPSTVTVTELGEGTRLLPTNTDTDYTKILKIEMTLATAGQCEIKRTGSSGEPQLYYVKVSPTSTNPPQQQDVTVTVNITDTENKLPAGAKIVFTPATGDPIKAVKDGSASLKSGVEYTLSIENADGTPNTDLVAKVGTSTKYEPTANATSVTITIADANEGPVTPTKPAQPSYSPKQGNVAKDTKVTLTAEGADAIRYTTGAEDVADPTATSGTEYNSTTGIVLGTLGDITIKAVAVKDGVASDVLTLKYKVVNEEDIKDGLQVELADEDAVYTYTGDAITPAIVVTNNGEELIEGVDYTVKYSNNKNANNTKDPNKQAKITVTGKGSFTGKAATTFTIYPKSLLEDDVNPVVAGAITVVKNKKVAPILVYNGIKLAAKDFTIEGDSKFDVPADGAETPKVKVVGKGNFKDSREIPVNVVASNSDLKKIAVKVNTNSVVYDGTRKDADITVTSGGATVEMTNDDNSENYTVVYNTGRTNAGTVKFTVIGLGAYTGSVTKTFKITPDKSATITASLAGGDNASYEYVSTGVTVPDSDITVSTATDTLTKDVDYKVTYSGNKKVTKNAPAKCNITFIGNYKGCRKQTLTFAITPATISDNTVDVVSADKVFKNPGLYKSAPVVISKTDGSLLKASDYTVKYYLKGEDGTEAEMKGANRVTVAGTTVYVKVTGKGNYANADDTVCATGEYTVCAVPDGAQDLSTAKIEFYVKGSDKKTTRIEYTGKAIEFNEGETPDYELRVMIGKGKNATKVPEDKYEITYANNTNKGKATVVITPVEGSTEYVGGKTATFNIVAQKVKNDLLGGLFGSTAQNFSDFIGNLLTNE